ncbi:MAG: TatD DNase family protein [Fusobacteria bacterium]|nr:MAG: TatD DNase family protein [Fusobacteriota bacterium]KAF0228776.1 MAG: TatD DNase family [Fusobacteriota bacterium]
MIDSHCHLNDPKLFADLDGVLERARSVGVELFIVPGYDLVSSEKAVSIATSNDGVYALVGIHPHDASIYNDEMEHRLEELLSNDKVVGLGEIGLDYHYDNSPREKQREVFIKQLELAKKIGKPVVIHSRDAFLETFEIIRDHGKGLSGVFHCFSGSYESAMRVIKELGFYISIAGPVTFKNAKEPLEVASRIPLEYLMIETDCPYLAPQPFRGKQNEPAYLPYIAERIKEVRGGSIITATVDNTKRLFGL